MLLPDVQYVLRPGIIELRWGDPSPDLLPADELARATAYALTRHGPDALNYGAEQGPGRLLKPLAAWLERAEGFPMPVEHLFITGGVSQALDLICTLWAGRGDVVLAEAPTYHLALRVFRDHGLEIAPVATDGAGLQPDALAAAIVRLRNAGRAARFLYTVPNFGNPTGVTMAPERRHAVVEIAAEHDLLVLEDDVYRHLWYDAPPPAPLSAFDASGATVVRLGSFSKLLAPGLKVGWLIAAPEIVRRLVGCGLLDSGGGLNHFAAHVAAGYLELGLLEPHIEALRAAYSQRRDVLASALARAMPPGADWRIPGGGFFIWLRLPDGGDSTALLPIAEAAGVSYAPGTRFFPAGGGERYLRLAHSLLPLDELEEGARRLGEALRAVHAIQESVSH